jgi:galactokinase/mevalonate kinase-like predicted kinase
MSQTKSIVASAPAAIAVAGDTCDISGKGGTLTLGIEGPSPSRHGGLRAFAMVSPGGSGATAIRVETTDEFTADTFFGAGRLLEIAGYAGNIGIAITLNSLIPPKLGLGGSAAQLVALLYALDAYFGRTRPREEAAEIVQRATLRPGQVHGYQKPYGATYGGVRYFGFYRKLTGLWAKGAGDLLDEPFALVSESRASEWTALGARIMLAVPHNLNLVSGELNSEIARRYREEDEETVKAMDRKSFVSELAHQRLVKGDQRAFWVLVDADTAIMEQWELISEEHRQIMALAKEQGAYAAKPASTGGAVLIYYPESIEQALLSALDEPAERIYLVSVAEGVRLEQNWPFDASAGGE